MSIVAVYSSIVNAGVNPSQTHTFSDKLQARNRLSFLCVIFSFIYFFYFLNNNQYLPLAAISFGIFLFGCSIILNQFQKFTVSSLLILFNTNYCVLFFSIYLGFNSGIHLYLFTSPLIVLTLFDTKSVLFISLAIMSYVSNFIILLIVEKVFHIDFQTLNDTQKDFFYTINFICSNSILITLALYFLFNNNKVNQLLILKNEQLQFQQEQLKEENSIRKLAEERAISSLSEREILLSEIHHRVKNNLAVVTALMELQSFYVNDKKTIQILKESQNRIKSIALLHEKLYENKSLKEVEVLSYTNELIHFIKQSLSNKEKNIQIHTQIAKINLEMTIAMPFGLLLNELITNSYKYAFLLNNEGNIWITISEKTMIIY
jgi:two-component sensor histidine kinase